jgi:rhodanese-related sulfurtransferase
MPRIIDRDEVRRLITNEDAQLVDVLPNHEYEREHLAGALSFPLKKLNAAAAARLDRRRPVVTYCHDYL